MRETETSAQQSFATGVACCILVFLLAPASLRGQNSDDQSKSWLDSVDGELGGHLKLRGTASFPEDDSLLGSVERGTYWDRYTEGRVKGQLFFGDQIFFEAHYETIFSGGDMRSSSQDLVQQYPGLFPSLPFGKPIDDSRRLMNLTSTPASSDVYVWQHRLDRLFFSYTPDWGTLRVGRQAVTWGNGLVFNPVDLFNPFAPTDIERDYKVGDDLIWFSTDLTPIRTAAQFLYVSRRDPATGSVQWDSSSLATKQDFSLGTFELSLMGAHHYADYVTGVGASGYLGGAAWRTDLTYTFVTEEQPTSQGYTSLVLNIDYSWVLFKKNFYGFLELYYNGLGESNYSQALQNPDLVSRIARGDLFTLGNTFWASHVQAELHPLFNLYLTAITNLQDPSCVLQPRGIWEILQSLQMTVGGSLFLGGEETEYGGFTIPETQLKQESPANLFVWLTFFF